MSLLDEVATRADVPVEGVVRVLTRQPVSRRIEQRVLAVVNDLTDEQFRVLARFAPATAPNALRRGTELAAHALEPGTAVETAVGRAVVESTTDGVPLAGGGDQAVRLGWLLEELVGSLKELKGDHIAERQDRLENLAVLVEMISTGWQGVDRRLGRLERAIGRLEQAEAPVMRAAPSLTKAPAAVPEPVPEAAPEEAPEPPSESPRRRLRWAGFAALITFILALIAALLLLDLGWFDARVGVPAGGAAGATLVGLALRARRRGDAARDATRSARAASTSAPPAFGALEPAKTNQLRLLRYARPHWLGILVLTGTMVLTVAVGLLMPWPMKLLIDNVLGEQPLPGALKDVLAFLPGADDKRGLLLWVVMGSLGLFLAATAIGMVNSIVSVRVGQQMAYNLGADMFLHLQRLSILFHSRRPVGDTIARVTGDPYCVQVMALGALLPLVQSVITLVAMFFVMWQLQPDLTLLSLGIVPFLILAIRIYSRPLKDTSRVTRDLEGAMMSVVQRTLTAVPAVQAFTREEHEHARFRAYARDTVSAYVRSTRAGLWFKLFVGFVSAAGTATMMYLGASYVLDGELTIGTLLVFLAYLGSLYGPLNSIAYTASTWQEAAAEADRVLEILEAVPEVQDNPDARDVTISGNVRYEDVTFGYEPGRPVLRNISLEARPGDVLAIVGPTGAGKSTLANLLIRFFDPWSGRVLVDGHDVRDIRIHSLRSQIAMVLQEPFIFPLTIEENIAYGRGDASHEEIVAAAKAANVHEFIEQLPAGYQTMVGERGATLSGGEKQRLSIARAFLKDAPILVLDEPTSALDARTEGMLLEALERLMEGRLTFIIAHRLSTIRNADSIVVVDHGEIVEQGTHAELLARGGLYAGLYRQQMEHARHDHAGSEVTSA